MLQTPVGIVTTWKRKPDPKPRLSNPEAPVECDGIPHGGNSCPQNELATGNADDMTNRGLFTSRPASHRATIGVENPLEPTFVPAVVEQKV